MLFATDLFRGVRNGKNAGKKCFIAVINVGEIRRLKIMIKFCLYLKVILNKLCVSVTYKLHFHDES